MTIMDMFCSLYHERIFIGKDLSESMKENIFAVRWPWVQTSISSSSKFMFWNLTNCHLEVLQNTFHPQQTLYNPLSYPVFYCSCPNRGRTPLFLSPENSSVGSVVQCEIVVILVSCLPGHFSLQSYNTSIEGTFSQRAVTLPLGKPIPTECGFYGPVS